MKQSQLGSLIEAVVNTIVGFLVTMIALPIVNAICGIEMNVGQATLSTALFTALSIGRGYVVRRVFNNFSSLKQYILTFLK